VKDLGRWGGVVGCGLCWTGLCVTWSSSGNRSQPFVLCYASLKVRFWGKKTSLKELALHHRRTGALWFAALLGGVRLLSPLTCSKGIVCLLFTFALPAQDQKMLLVTLRNHFFSLLQSVRICWMCSVEFLIFWQHCNLL
jgi:hypothetical protein